eukprot:15444333-Alexandrium_andersonii.AAC.1
MGAVTTSQPCGTRHDGEGLLAASQAAHDRQEDHRGTLVTTSPPGPAASVAPAEAASQLPAVATSHPVGEGATTRSPAEALAHAVEGLTAKLCLNSPAVTTSHPVGEDATTRCPAEVLAHDAGGLSAKQG